MKKSGNKKLSSNRIKKLQNPSKILRIYCYTPISKPLNGSLPRSNSSHLLRLYPIKYTYTSGNRKKVTSSETYLIKGIRGILRHQAMKIFKNLGFEGCHSSDKEKDKAGNILIPEGFHPLGLCGENGGSCLINQIFGSKGQESLISVYADPITSISHKTAKMTTQVQQVHLVTENRVSISYTGESIQDFREKYFSGDFIFEIDVTRCSNLHIGFLLQCVLGLERLGRGYNSGYGHLKIKKFQLLRRKITRVPKWEEDSFTIIEDNQEESLRDEVLNALQEWDSYVSHA